MPWINSSADIKGIAYNVGQRIDTLTGTCYSNVTGTSSGYTFEQLSSMYGYTYYYGGIWQAPGGEAVAAPYGIRIGSGGSILFSASADNFPSALYAINYNGNGGSDMSAWTQTKRWGEAMALTTEVPKRTGHTFSNWQDRAPGQAGATGYAPGAVYDRNESVTMYAMWRIDTYTVSYNANGGIGAPGNQTKTFGQTLILSASRPVRVGYNFMGWSTAPSGGVNYHPGGNYTANTPITLYAVWSLITYSITYNANGGSGAPTIY